MLDFVLMDFFQFLDHSAHSLLLMLHSDGIGYISHGEMLTVVGLYILFFFHSLFFHVVILITFQRLCRWHQGLDGLSLDLVL